MWTVLTVVIFLLNGEPVLTGELIPGGQQCGEAQARELAEALQVEFQNEILWKCEVVSSPGPVR